MCQINNQVHHFIFIFDYQVYKTCFRFNRNAIPCEKRHFTMDVLQTRYAINLFSYDPKSTTEGAKDKTFNFT